MFKKYEGFEVVKKLIDNFDDMYFYVHGGSAGYLHAINKFNKEIDLHDIDVAIISNQTTANINNKIITFIKNNYENVTLVNIDDLNINIDDLNNELETIYYVNIGNNISLNFFVNEILEIPRLVTNINGINVEIFQKIIKNETLILNDLTDDLKYCTKHCIIDEVKYLESKIKRKQEFLNLVNNK